MLTIPAPLADLGVSQPLKAALLKLAAALPATRRRDEERVRQRIYLDSVWWFQSHEPVPYLQMIQQAVWEDRKLRLQYRLPFAGIEVERVVEPYGLVAKAGIWYLVYARNGRVRAYRVAHLLQAQILSETLTWFKSSRS
jgi:predicted DNA-binding transcriptional regulator YafY